MYLSVFNNFRVIRCLSQCVSPKIAIFTTFLFPLIIIIIIIIIKYICKALDRSATKGAITLNVVWMEREFDAYKLSRCMCQSNYYHFWDTARYFLKNRHFILPPLHSTPPLGGFPSEYRHPLWNGKLEWCRYPKVIKFRRYVYSFWRLIHECARRTDGLTDRHCVTA